VLADRITRLRCLVALEQVTHSLALGVFGGQLPGQHGKSRWRTSSRGIDSGQGCPFCVGSVLGSFIHVRGRSPVVTRIVFARLADGGGRR